MEREKRLSTAAVAALAYLAVAVLWAAPSSLSPLDAVPDLGDPVHLSYVMAWDAHQLVRAPWALFDSNSFHPYPRSLTFGDHLLPEAIAVAPVFWATGNAILASNVGVLLALTFSAFAMFLLVRRITGSSEAAFLAGLAYAFNSFTRHELPRLHVLNIQWWPLALLFLDRFVRGGRRRDAAWLAVFLLLQGLSGTYYLVYTALLAPLWFVIAFGSERRWPRAAEWRALAIAAALASVPRLVVLAPYLAQMRSMAFEKGLEPGVDILSYLAPLTLWGRLSPKGIPGTGSHFIGYLTLALAALGVGLDRASAAAWARRVALATAALGFVLSLGWTVKWYGQELVAGPYRLLYWGFPPARGMAGPERLGVLVPLGLALLVGLGAAALLSRLRGPGRVALFLSLAVLLPLEHWRAPREAWHVPTGAAVPAVYTWAAAESRAPLVDLPLYPDVSRKFYAVYLNLSTHHFRPIPIGRTSFYPPIHDLLAWYLRDFPDAASLTLLERLGIHDVVVHPRAWEDPAERAQRLLALQSEPRLTLAKQFTDVPPARYDALNLGGESVYRIAGVPAPLEAPCVPADEIDRAGWALSASGDGDPQLARDGDRRTAWRIGPPQKPGDGFEVELPRRETLAAVALDLYYPYGEFPRNLKLLTREGDGWQRLDYADGPAERWATIQGLLERPREARLVLRVAPRPVSRLRLAVGGREEDASWPPWSLPELHLFGSCR
jgi:hypothetical protein